jgi:mRNA-degrading endonuclease RelE of RelBE toxin-antitoxin system
MSFKIIPLHDFRKEAKRLSKKYPSLKNELAALAEQLANNPLVVGTEILDKSQNIRKIRLGVQSKGSGKSGGLRVIAHSIFEINLQIDNSPENEGFVYLISIYDKSEHSTVDEKILKELVEEIGKDFKNTLFSDESTHNSLANDPIPDDIPDSTNLPPDDSN